MLPAFRQSFLSYDIGAEGLGEIIRGNIGISHMLLMQGLEKNVKHCKYYNGVQPNWQI